MELPDLKKLDKLIALCRKRGVTEVVVGDLKLTLGDAPPKKYSPEETKIETFEEEPDLTEAQLVFYSVNPHSPGEAS